MCTQCRIGYIATERWNIDFCPVCLITVNIIQHQRCCQWKPGRDGTWPLIRVRDEDWFYAVKTGMRKYKVYNRHQYEKVKESLPNKAVAFGLFDNVMDIIRKRSMEE